MNESIFRIQYFVKSAGKRGQWQTVATLENKDEACAVLGNYAKSNPTGEFRISEDSPSPITDLCAE